MINVPDTASLTTLAVAFSLATLAIYSTMPFWRKNQMPVDGRLVVITGGSQGMGKSVALQLSAKGANIAIIARDQAKLSAAIVEIEAAAARPGEQAFLTVSADLTSSREARRALDEVTSWGGVPDVVWACAGGAVPGYFKDLDSEVLEKQVKTNYFSVLYTAHAAIRLMTANPLPSPSPKRHLIFTSSVLSFYPIAGYNAYSPSKAAIRSLSDGLRQECILYNIAVHCCFPGTIYSPGFEVEQQIKPELTKILEGNDEGQTPDEVARVCIGRLEKGHYLVVTQFLGEAMRAAAWGGSPRGSWVWDTVFSWVVACVWAVIIPVMDGHVYKYLKDKGVPSPEGAE